MTVAAGERRRLARDTATITALNLVSRFTGFARVLAIAAALGTTALGDTYQSANLVSNVLFELLAGGLLSAVLVPTFVELIDRGERAEATRLAGSLLARTLAVLGAVVGVGMVLSPWIMRLLTVGVSDADVRRSQLHLGTFLLLFFLPQVLLYATGAVATGLLQADRRFLAAAAAPVANNLVVIATMVIFRARRSSSTSFALHLSDKLVLAIGTTSGVLAMTTVVVLALRGSGLSLAPRRDAAGAELRALAKKGAWAAGHLGVNQLLVAVTIVLAAGVRGGVVAYQVAFTFFLLPHAVLSNPIYTALFPRLASDARAGRLRAFGEDLSLGVRFTGFLLVPAAGLLAVLAPATLQVVRVGNLDAAGADLVSHAVAAYAIGLLGYSAYFLLTRASYALDDVRSPTMVNAAASLAAGLAMVAMATSFDGAARLVALGLVHAAAVTAASAVLLRRLQRRAGVDVAVLPALCRDVVAAAVACLAAWLVSDAIGTSGRATALASLLCSGIVGVVTYVAVQRLARASELGEVTSLLRGAS